MFQRIKNHFPIFLLVSVNLMIGLYVLPEFGESKDERSQNSYAERTIQTIHSVFRHGYAPTSFIEEEAKQGSHGPVFIALVSQLRSLFLPKGSSIEKLYFNHFLYFIVFQIGVVSIYFLALRWVSRTAAFGTALLFNTQPILSGHAFMNSKDVVFMSLMVASAAVSLWMVDRGGKSFQATGHPLSDGIRSFFREFLYGDVWLAGLLLGFASAVRVAAPLIGVIVIVIILLSRKYRVFPRFFAFGLIAFCSMIVFWPYLWLAPIERIMGSISISTYYPDVHMTLFQGMLFDAKDIPRSYLPVLLAVQLTETTLLLILVGAFPFLRIIHWDLVALVLIWFVLPVAVVILAQVHLYNNFRQFFFILPPLFFISGLGLDWLFTIFRRPATRYLIIFLALLPGLYANIRLYPYQYVYYNQLVGGVSGAFRNFDLDYWNLAFREAQLYLNQTAGKDANIYAGDLKSVARTFARPDLSL